MNDTRTPTALALWLLFLAPQWVLLLWGMKRLTALRQAVARSILLQLLAVGCWIGSIFLAANGTAWVCRELLDPERLGVQRVVRNGVLVDQVLIIAVGLLLLVKADARKLLKRPRGQWGRNQPPT
jgi:hypothetical protein